MLLSLCQQIWKTQNWPQDWKRSVFIPIPKKDNAKECSNYCTIALISHASKVMLKTLQARRQLVHELVEPWTSRCSSWIWKRQRSQRSNWQHPLDHWKSKRFQKNIYFSFIDYAKAFDFVDQNKWGETLQEMGIPDHLTCLLRNLYAGQEATVRTGHGTTDWFLLQKGVCQGCILSPCLFNLYAEYIMQNAKLD